MLSAADGRISDEKASSLPGCERQVRLWMLMTKTEPPSRSAAFVLQMSSVARQVCPRTGGDHLENADGALRKLGILRNYFDPDAADSKNQEVARVMQFRRTDRNVDGYIAEYDLLRRKAESERGAGAGFLEKLVSSLRIRNSGLSRREKSLVSARSRKGPKFVEVAACMRR